MIPKLSISIANLIFGFALIMFWKKTNNTNILHIYVLIYMHTTYTYSYILYTHSYAQFIHSLHKCKYSIGRYICV